MGILVQIFIHFLENKIPEYARNFRNEYLFIIGINKTCERFVKKIDGEENVFNTSQAKKLIFYFNKFLKAQKLEYLKDISEFYLKEDDVKFIEYLECKLDDYMDLFYDPVSYKFDQEKYENDNLGFKEFFESFRKFNDKINIEKMSFSYLVSDSDSDSDGVDSDDIKNILCDSGSD